MWAVISMLSVNCYQCFMHNNGMVIMEEMPVVLEKHPGI